MENPLPIKNNLSFPYLASLLIAILIAMASISGLLYRDLYYPTEEIIQTFVPNDVVNLFIGLPILLGSMWATQRRKLLGLLFWTGAIFFILYNSLAYVFALPFSWIFLYHLVAVVLSMYTLIILLLSIDHESIQKKLHGAVHEKISGGVITGFGILFLLRVFFITISALINGENLAATELAPNISDIFISPALIIVGIALWKQKALGYLGGLGLLFQASMLFIGLIIFLLLQPILTNAAFLPFDIIVIFVMGLICFVPFILFMRGVRMKDNSAG